MDFVTKTQEVVVKSRLNNGYKLLGKSVSLLNGFTCFVLVKEKHTIVVNSLGYDEHSQGISWKIHD